MKLSAKWSAYAIAVLVISVHAAEEQTSVPHNHHSNRSHVRRVKLHPLPQADPTIAEKYTPIYKVPGPSAEERMHLERDARVASQPRSRTMEEDIVEKNERKIMSEDVQAVSHLKTNERKIMSEDVQAVSHLKTDVGEKDAKIPHSKVVRAAQVQLSESSAPSADDPASSSEVRTEYVLRSDAHGGFAVNGVEHVHAAASMPIMDEKPSKEQHQVDLSALRQPTHSQGVVAVQSAAGKSKDAIPTGASSVLNETPTKSPAIQASDTAQTVTEAQAVDYCFKCVMSYPGKGLIPCGVGHSRIQGTKGVLGPDMAHAATETCIENSRLSAPKFAAYCFADAIEPCPKTEKIRYVFNCYIKNPSVGGSPYERCPIPGPKSNDVLVVEDAPGLAGTKTLLDKASRICSLKNQESLNGCMAIPQDLVPIN